MKQIQIKKLWLLLIFLLHPLEYLFLQQESIDHQLWQKAQRIHQEAIVVDTHTDTPLVLMENPQLDLGFRGDNTSINHLDFPRMIEGGLDAVFFAVFVSNRLDQKHPAKNALQLIDVIYQQIQKNNQIAELALSPQDIRHSHQKGKRCILIGMENGSPVEESLALLRNYFRLGVRYITLTHNSHNIICDSSMGGKPKWKGLSPFGKKMIKEMNDIGMMIDISHISDQAFWDVLKESRSPVFASHSCVRSLCNVPRNMSDEMIKALAKKNGVIQINFYSAFLDEVYKNKAKKSKHQLEPLFQQYKKKYKRNRLNYWIATRKIWKSHGPPSPKIESLIAHIEYVIKLVGIDHVGIGSDYDGASSFPEGLEDVTGYPLITYHLLKKGYSENDIKKILGENFLRFFDEVLKNAKSENQSEH